MSPRSFRIIPVVLAMCGALALTARAAAHTGFQVPDQPPSGVGSGSNDGSHAGLDGSWIAGAKLPAEGSARDRLRALLESMDEQAALLERSSDPEIVAEAARTRASFAAAIPAVGRLSEKQAADLIEMLPTLVGGFGMQPMGVSGAAATPMASPDQNDSAELEQFRTDLNELFDHYGEWSYLVPYDDQYMGFVQDGRDLVASLTYEDLAAIRAQLGEIPNWQSSLAPDLTSLVPPGAFPDAVGVGPGDRISGGHHVLDGVGTVPLGDVERPSEFYPLPRRPSIDMGSQCLLATTVLTLPQLEARIIAETVLRYVSLALKFAGEVAPKDIKITVLGVTVDIPNPYTLLILIGRAVVNRVADGLAAELSVNAYCASTVHWNVMVLHAQSLVDRSQDILYQELEFANRLTARYNALDLAERELWKMQLQLGIEENLLLDAPRADGSDENRMALFQFTDTVCFNNEELLPTPVPPFEPPVAPTPVDPLLDPCHDQALLGPSACGSPIDPPDRYVPLPTLAAIVGPPDPREECGLNLARRVVAESIQHNQQAGQNIHNALSLLAAGDAFLANHQYGQAYIRYRQAYQAAVKPDPSPRSR